MRVIGPSARAISSSVVLLANRQTVGLLYSTCLHMVMELSSEDNDTQAWMVKRIGARYLLF